MSDLAREGAASDAEWLALQVARFRKPCSRWFRHSLRHAQIATLDRAWEAQVQTLHTARAHQCLRHARPDQRGPFFSLKICRLFWINKIRSEDMIWREDLSHNGEPSAQLLLKIEELVPNIPNQPGISDSQARRRKPHSRRFVVNRHVLCDANEQAQRAEMATLKVTVVSMKAPGISGLPSQLNDSRHI